MAYNSRVYRILIASPSDVEEEREIAVRVIQEWNDLHSYTRKVALLPLRWETHTAPEYGTRPQEVINRAIVDECDLLIGIFWSRIGSPTGIAESGTLEEIERVGNAGKPIMLYFSRAGIDPEKIDLKQIEKLQAFKDKTYPNGLVEGFKSSIEFRDKLWRQLELKVRDLQHDDKLPKVPLSIDLLSLDHGRLTYNSPEFEVEYPLLQLDDEAKKEITEKIKTRIASEVRARATIPIAMILKNNSSSGIKNLFIRLHLRSSPPTIQVSDTFMEGFSSNVWKRIIVKNMDLNYSIFNREEFDGSICTYRPDKLDDLEKKISELETIAHLRKIGEDWEFSFDWEAIQPQRIRPIKPIFYIHAVESVNIEITAEVFAEIFP